MEASDVPGVVHLGHPQVLDGHDRRRQRQDDLPPAEVPLRPQLAGRLGEERQLAGRVVPQVTRDVGPGGGHQLRLPAGGEVHLGHPQPVGPEVDADRVGGRGEPALYEREHRHRLHTLLPPLPSPGPAAEHVGRPIPQPRGLRHAPRPRRARRPGRDVRTPRLELRFAGEVGKPGRSRRPQPTRRATQGLTHLRLVSTARGVTFREGGVGERYRSV